MLKNLTQDKHCLLWRGKHFDIGRNREALLAPGLETAGKRSNICKSPPPEGQGYACASKFARTRAVKDNLTVGRQIRDSVFFIPFKLMRIDPDGARNCHDSLGLPRAALQVQDQDIFASAQFVHELIRRDPSEPEFAQESIPANEPEDEKDAKPCNPCEDHQRSHLRRVTSDAIQLTPESVTQSRVGRRPKNRANSIKGQKPWQRSSRDSCHRSGDGVQSNDELGNQENFRSVAIEPLGHLPYTQTWISRVSAHEMQRSAAPSAPGFVPRQIGQ